MARSKIRNRESNYSKQETNWMKIALVNRKIVIRERINFEGGKQEGKTNYININTEIIVNDIVVNNKL